MAKEEPFVILGEAHTHRGRITLQMLRNEYYYENLGRINQHMVKWNKTFEWKLRMMERLESRFGLPVNLTKWQIFLANALMF